MFYGNYEDLEKASESDCLSIHPSIQAAIYLTVCLFVSLFVCLQRPELGSVPAKGRAKALSRIEPHKRLQRKKASK